MVCLKDYLKEDHVLFLEKGDKKSILDQMIDNLSSSSSITDKDAFSTAIFDRETIISTGIGLGIAIPHVKIPSVRDGQSTRAHHFSYCSQCRSTPDLPSHSFKNCFGSQEKRAAGKTGRSERPKYRAKTVF